MKTMYDMQGSTNVYENSTSSNYTRNTCENLSAETLDYLNSLNHEVTLNTIPLQLFYFFLIVIGTIGNILVIYIYGKKLQKTSAVQFILKLAYIDLFSCIVVIPFNFTEIYIKFTFTYVGMCKLLEYVRATAEALSCLTLTYIAIDRYFAICKPLSFAMHGQKAKFALYFNILLALVIMLPALFMYGVRTVELEGGNIGCTCYIRDYYYLGVWHVLFRTFQFTLNLTLFVIISLLYILVYRTVHQRIRAPSSPRLQSPTTIGEPKGIFRQKSSKRRKISPAPDNVPTIRIEMGDTRRKPSMSSVSSVELNMEIREICKSKIKPKEGETSLAGKRKASRSSSAFCSTMRNILNNCIPCQKANRRDSILPMVRNINIVESSSSQDERNYSVTSAPASLNNANDDEELRTDIPSVRKISDGVLTKQSNAWNNTENQELNTFSPFAAESVQQVKKGDGKRRNRIRVEENSMASSPLQNKPQSNGSKDPNGIKFGENNLGSKRPTKTKNRFNLTLPPRDRHTIYQAGMMVGKMRKTSLPVSYRQNSTEETMAYLSEAALNHYQRTRYKTAMILLTVTVIFLLTWTPFWILYVVFFIHQEFWDDMNYAEQNIYRMLRYMYLINHAINPIIYAFAHKQFRDDLKAVFKKVCCRNKF